MAVAAPVFPAETKAAALPSFTILAATVMEESLFFRIASVGFSCISTTSDAGTIVMFEGRFGPKTRSISEGIPTRHIWLLINGAANSAPATIASGALSPPIASTAMLKPYPRPDV